MAVLKKKMPNGQFSKYWYYEFKLDNQRYRGSTFLKTKPEALAFEKKRKTELQEAKDIIDKPQDKRKASLIRFREQITDQISGSSIKLEDVWSTFYSIGPGSMKKIPCDKGWQAKETYWNDFLFFLKNKHKDLNTLRDVTEAHAKEYSTHLKTLGKFNKIVSYKGRKYLSKNTKLAHSTVNEYIKQIKQIFNILSPSAGLISNPFDSVPLAQNKKKSREIFEIEELEQIRNYLSRLKTDSKNLTKAQQLDFIINEALFTIGINTGLRRADICLLKWTDVNFNKNVIYLESRKTDEKVFIPLTKNLHSFIREKFNSKSNTYVVPELASMYLSNSVGTTYRFKKMLAELAIESLKAYEERSRKTSVKDIHALRHTFCYLHGFQGTPIVTLQSMVGHMSAKMTEAYTLHSSEQSKRDAIQRFSFGNIVPNSLNEVKNKIIQAINSCQDENQIKAFSDFVFNKSEKSIEDQKNSNSLKLK